MFTQYLNMGYIVSIIYIIHTADVSINKSVVCESVVCVIVKWKIKTKKIKRIR